MAISIGIGIRIEHEADAVNAWRYLLEQLQRFAEHRKINIAKAGDVAARRFPPPWSIEERQESFIVKDASGQPLAYLYSRIRPTTSTWR
jgi:hypothetical protein